MKFTRKHLGLTIVFSLLIGVIVILTREVIRPRTPEEIEISSKVKVAEWSKIVSLSTDYQELEALVMDGFFTPEETKFILKDFIYTEEQQRSNRIKHPDINLLLFKYMFSNDPKWTIRHYYIDCLGLPMCANEGSDTEIDKSWIPQYVYHEKDVNGKTQRVHNEPFHWPTKSKKEIQRYVRWERMTDKLSKPMHEFDTVDPKKPNQPLTP